MPDQRDEPGAPPVAVRVFRVLLMAYPKPFREAFGDEMEQAFRTVLRHEPRHGLRGSIGFWRRTLWDLAASVMRERSEAMERGPERWVMLGASAAGLSIAWVDSRPTWDDTGITAGSLFLAGALCAAICPKRPRIWAVAVGIWLPLFNIALHGNAASLIALGFPLLGAYSGAFFRRLISPAPGD